MKNEYQSQITRQFAKSVPKFFCYWSMPTVCQNKNWFDLKYSELRNLKNLIYLSFLPKKVKVTVGELEKCCKYPSVNYKNLLIAGLVMSFKLLFHPNN